MQLGATGSSLGSAPQQTKLYLKGLLLKVTYSPYTHNGFDDQERNVMFVKTDFQVLKLKFHVCNFKQDFYPLLIYRANSQIVSLRYKYLKFCFNIKQTKRNFQQFAITEL